MKISGNSSFPEASLEEAILLTLTYADIFEYPLVSEEIHQYLIGRTASLGEVKDALFGGASLPHKLCQQDAYFALQGREAIIAVRKKRKQISEQHWEWAFRYARWLTWVPFVRMVAVSGSLAVENTASENDDVDVFCITAVNRLWVARFWLALLRVITAVFPAHLCSNYLVTLSSLETQTHNLFVAHEVAQIVPLWGLDVYHDFLAANQWVQDLMPNIHFHPQQRFAKNITRPAPTRWAEWLLRGKAGDKIDSWILKLFHKIQPIRLRKQLGWSQAQFEQAYAKNRQVQIDGGYSWIIQKRFIARI